ncbi:MAG: hypothetical protein HY363_05065 [Candidatus Aenigmarchaeota archaeon]|nr:hypothetical protein [Candidatus Aenigmarchaeota archaeon]
MDELQRFSTQSPQGAEAEQQIVQLECAVKSIMSPDARSRFANIKLASPQRAVQVLLVLAQLVHAGGIEQIDDASFRDVLVKMQSKETRLFRK